MDLRNASGFVPSIPGPGILDHVAFRAPDAEAVRKMRLALKDAADVTNVHNRKYFLSLYVREPAGTLIEFATDGPALPSMNPSTTWAKPCLSLRMTQPAPRTLN